MCPTLCGRMNGQPLHSRGKRQGFCDCRIHPRSSVSVSCSSEGLCSGDSNKGNSATCHVLSRTALCLSNTWLSSSSVHSPSCTEWMLDRACKVPCKFQSSGSDHRNTRALWAPVTLKAACFHHRPAPSPVVGCNLGESFISS